MRVSAKRGDMLRYIIILLALCALLGGCADPLVYYTPIIKEDNEGMIKFANLQNPMINFNFAKTTAGILTDDIVISSVPLPYGEQKFGIVGTRIWQNWGVETTVSATFRGDTDLIQQLSVICCRSAPASVPIAGINCRCNWGSYVTTLGATSHRSTKGNLGFSIPVKDAIGLQCPARARRSDFLFGFAA